MSYTEKDVKDLAEREYEHGFVSDIDTDVLEKGLNEDVIRVISSKKEEPDWLLEWRLNAYRGWVEMREPTWQKPTYPPINYQDISYYAAPKQKPKLDSMDDVDPEIREMFDKLGIPLEEQKMLSNVAVDAIVDSVSVTTTFKEKLAEAGVIFCSFSEAVQNYPELVRANLGSVVPTRDNYFAALNSAVFSDGSFCYVPEGVRCPMELSTYFRINSAQTGQFERTLIVAEKGSHVSYLEGCLLEGERIELPTGEWRCVEDVAPKDEVVGHDGNPTRVVDVMKRDYNGKKYNIIPLSTGNAFTVTREHPILTVRRSDAPIERKPRKENWQMAVDTSKLIRAEPDWVRADELKVGDFMVFPKRKKQQLPELPFDFMRLAGYFLAEGHCGMVNNRKALIFSFHIDEVDFIEEVRSLCERLWGKRGSVFEDPTKNEAKITVYTNEGYDLMKEHCGTGASEKRVSPQVFNQDDGHVMALIDAYVNGDGNRNVEKNGGEWIRCHTVSKDWAFQLQALMTRFHIFSTVNLSRPAGPGNILGRQIHRKDLWMVQWRTQKKVSEVRDAGDYFLVPIKSIEVEDFEGPVFNFETENVHSYLVKGFATHNCTAPMRDENQLHAAVVELVAHEDATIKYSTVQNWYPGDAEGRGGIYNFVTKRGRCAGARSKISWTQVETGSAITWKYPSVILAGDDSVGEFYSVALTAGRQQADTGTKMVHIGRGTTSTIVSKGISAGHGENTYRGQVKVLRSAEGARNFTQCDSLLIGSDCGAHTLPYVEVKNASAQVEHEASTSKIGEDQLFYARQRGISEEDATSMIVNGFCREVFNELPMEFAVEAQRLLEVSLEGSVG